MKKQRNKQSFLFLVIVGAGKGKGPKFFFPIELENTHSGTAERFKLNIGMVSLNCVFKTYNWLM